MKRIPSLVAAFALALVGSAQAQTVITFEDGPPSLTAMTNSPGVMVPLASRLSTQYLSSAGVTFSSGSSFVALVNHGGSNASASVPNVIGGTTADGKLAYNQLITIAFFDVTDPSVQATTNRFQIQGDWIPLGTGQAFATAFDAAGQEIGTTSDTDNKPARTAGAVLAFNLPGIHRVVIGSTNNTVGFDQLEFGPLQPVPEPETWALLGVGLVLVAGIARRRPVAARIA